MKKVVFRVNASSAIGSGHFMRCLTLAGALCDQGLEIHFISSNLPEAFELLLKNRQFTLHALAMTEVPRVGSSGQGRIHNSGGGDGSLRILESLGGVDLVVADDYAIDMRWERYVRSKAKRIVVIDDLADRPHDCDILLDQNIYADQETRYKPHVPSDTRCLLGPRYALVRSEFTQVRAKVSRLERTLGPVKLVNICFGGVDATGETLKALEALRPWLDEESLRVDVVLGATSPHHEAVGRWAKRYATITVHIAPENLAELLAAADVGLGASGSMTWERACVGLPSIVMSVAPNQHPIGEGSARVGMTLYIGKGLEVSKEELRSAVAKVVSDPALRKNLADYSLQMVDGRGAERVAEEVKG